MDARRRGPAAADRASSKRCRPMRSCWRSGQESESGFLRRRSGRRSSRWTRSKLAIRDDDRPSGHVRRRRHGAGERTVTVAVGHGKKAARRIDAWLRGEHYRQAGRSAAGDFDMLHLPVFSDADPAEQRELSLAERVQRLRGSGGGPDRNGGTARGAALPVLRQLLRMRQLLRGLSGAGDRQARPGHGLSRRSMRSAPAARSASNSARATPSR